MNTSLQHGLQPRGRPARMPDSDMHRLRQLLNTYSGVWVRRGPLLFQQDHAEGFESGSNLGEVTEEVLLGTCTTDDVAELVLLLRGWFWPLYNETVMLRKKLADARTERRQLEETLRKEGFIV